MASPEIPGWLVGPIAFAFWPPPPPARGEPAEPACGEAVEPRPLARRAAACASRSAGGGGASFRPKYIPAGSFGQFGTSLYPPSPCASRPRPAIASAPASSHVLVTARIIPPDGISEFQSSDFRFQIADFRVESGR